MIVIVYVHTYIHTYIRTYVRTYVRTYLRMHAHSHTRAQTNTHMQEQPSGYIVDVEEPAEPLDVQKVDTSKHRGIQDAICREVTIQSVGAGSCAHGCVGASASAECPCKWECE